MWWPTLIALNNFFVPNVHHEPKILINLLSVPQLTDTNCSVSFDSISCYIHDVHTEIQIGTGHKQDGHYSMDKLTLPCPVVAPPRPTRPCLRYLSDCHALGNFFFSNFKSKYQSQGGKTLGLTLCTSNHISLSPFDMVHYDVWGSSLHASKGIVGTMSILSMITVIVHGIT